MTTNLRLKLIQNILKNKYLLFLFGVNEIIK